MTASLIETQDNTSKNHHTPNLVLSLARRFWRFLVDRPLY